LGARRRGEGKEKASWFLETLIEAEGEGTRSGSGFKKEIEQGLFKKEGVKVNEKN